MENKISTKKKPYARYHFQKIKVFIQEFGRKSTNLNRMLLDSDHPENDEEVDIYLFHVLLPEQVESRNVI